ncbi:MAG: zf-TFIIB domain-containing protein [Dehalococcoidia bacterium]
MNCPKCQVVMREREKDDLIIDVCPQCRGVWLDAGELEKLTVRERSYYGDRDDDDDDDDRRRATRYDDRDRREDYGRRDGYAPRKKKGFLSTIFESMGGDD